MVRFNPLLLLVGILALASAAAFARDIRLSLYFFLVAAIIGGLANRRMLLRAFAVLTPMAFGLAWFNSFVGGNLILGFLVFLKVLTLASTSVIFASLAQPYEFALSLHRFLRVPYQLAISVALAYSLLISLLKFYDELVESAKARWLIKTELGVLWHLRSIMSAAMIRMSRQLDQLTDALTARGFGLTASPETRKIGIFRNDIVLLLIFITSAILPYAVISSVQ